MKFILQGFLSTLLVFSLHAQENRNYERNKQSMYEEACPYSYVYPLNNGMIYAEGEWLYWKLIAEIPFADVITIQRFQPTTTQEYPGDDKEIRNRFNFESGYRVKLGFDFPHDGWNFYGQYQKITASTRKNVDLKINETDAVIQTDENKILYPYWANTSMRGSQFIKYKWGAAFSSQNAKYRVLDLMLNKTFYTKGSFAFTPGVGVRSAWIRNELNVAYTGVNGDVGGGAVVRFMQSIIKLQNNFYGWGLKFGATANWIIGWGFELFGKSHLSTIYGDLIYRQRDDFIDRSGNSDLDIRGSSHRETTWNKVLNCLEVGAGVNWGMRLFQDKMYFGIVGNYEFNYWPDFIRLNRYGYTRLPDDNTFDLYSTPVFAVFQNSLTLHGITLGAKLEY